MQEVRKSCPTLCLASLAALWCLSATDPATAQVIVERKLRCEALLDSRNLTLTRAEIAENPEDGSAYCYVRGIISPAIHFHAQLPLLAYWNGRVLLTEPDKPMSFKKPTELSAFAYRERSARVPEEESN